MKFTSGDDIVYTPDALAKRLVDYFKPSGKILEPCSGGGAFLKYLTTAEWCEIEQGRDFLDWEHPVDWIITNPPWSKFRIFLRRSLRLAKDIIFLITLNHIWTKARVRLILGREFGIKEIILIDMPSEFPASGFQLEAVHLSKNWKGLTQITDWTKKKEWWE